MNDDRPPADFSRFQPYTGPVHQTLLLHLRRMPRWHRRVLMLAVVLIGLGVAGVVRRTVTPTSSVPASQPAVAMSHGGGSGFVAESAKPQAAEEPWYLSPRCLAIGGSTIGGFVIGWAMRAFVKTVTLVLASIGGLIAALSYFRFFNVDFSAAHQQFASATTWFYAQIGLLKDAAIAHLPSHAGAVVGAYMGFKRR